MPCSSPCAYEEVTSLVQQAKDYSLLPPDLPTDESVSAMQKAIENPETIALSVEVSSQQSDLRSDIALANRIVRNLRLLKKEYTEYRSLLGEVEDSLRPVAYLRESLGELVQTSIFDRLMGVIAEDLSQVKQDIRKRVPIDTNIGGLIAAQEERIEELKRELARLPREASALLTDRERFLFLGEAKAKLELYGSSDDTGALGELTAAREDAESRLETLNVDDPQEARARFIRLLEEIALEYLKLLKPVVGKYKDYLPVFDYGAKALKLRRPMSPNPENVGSSSNDMYLHLILFLSLHEAIKIQESPFVPPFIIIDQPSRPYWGDPKDNKPELEESDEAKVRAAFKLLNSFIARMKEKDEQCQLIVFEHVPPETWSDLDNVNLVEQFGNRNALIREDDLTS